MTESLPYESSYHTPIMVREVLEWLNIVDGGVYMDATLGGGGHSNAILEAASTHVHGLDRDPDAIQQASNRLESFGDRFTTHQCNYSEALDVVEAIGQKVDGVLLDAGVSSHQLNEASRGFSFMRSGPLDMRMGPDTQSALEFLSQTDENSLTRVLKKYGELRSGRKVARAILEAVAQGTLDTTESLRKVVEGSIGFRQKQKSIHPATLVFQAIRIHINDELQHLQTFVDNLPRLVRPGGRVVILSFHSLEDRIVKQGFRALESPCTCPPNLPFCACGARPHVKILTKKPIRPTLEEVDLNPRSRSTLLRAAEVLGE